MDSFKDSRIAPVLDRNHERTVYCKHLLRKTETLTFRTYIHNEKLHRC